MDEEGIDQLDSEYGDAEEYEDNPDVFSIRLASHKLAVLIRRLKHILILSIHNSLIRDPLEPPEATVLATKTLHQLIHEGHIDLSPPYQRG